MESKKFKPGDHPEDYRYLFAGHSHLLSECEWKAWYNLMMRFKVGRNGKLEERMQKARWFSKEPEVLALLEDGEEEFYRRTLARVLRETPEGLKTCPKCGSLCRTSKACLCPHCSHTWYETRTRQ